MDNKVVRVKYVDGVKVMEEVNERVVKEKWVKSYEGGKREMVNESVVLKVVK